MFAKSILTSFKRKPLQPLAIILTVCFVTAVFIAALALSGSAEGSFRAAYKAFSGEAELEIELTADSPALLLTEGGDNYAQIEEEASKYGTLLSGYFYYASVKAGQNVFSRVYSTDISAFSNYHNVKIVSGVMCNKRTDAVISRGYAQKNGLGVGSQIKLSLYGTKYYANLEVVGVAENSDVFLETDVLTSSTVASRLMGMADDIPVCNRLFVKLSKQKLSALGIGEKEAKTRLGAALAGYTVTSPVKEESLAATLSYDKALIFTVTFVAAILGAVLIYTVFLLLLKDRLHSLALFKSVGASSLSVGGLLTAECVAYGTAGSLLGVPLSVAVGRLFGVALGVSGAALKITFVNVLCGIVFGVVLSAISALLPILSVARTSITGLLASGTKNGKYGVATAVSAVCAAALVIAVCTVPVNASLYVGLFGVLAVFALCWFAVPFVIRLLCGFIMHCTKNRAGLLHVSASGMRLNKSAQMGARILAVALTAVVAITSLLAVADRQERNFEGIFKTEVLMQGVTGGTEGLLSEVKNEQGVSAAYEAYVALKCVVENADITVTVLAANLSDYDEVFDIEALDGVSSEVLFGGGKAVISDGIATKLGARVGDKIDITIGEKTLKFEIAGTYNAPVVMVFTDIASVGAAGNSVAVKTTGGGVYDNLAEKYSRTAVVTTPHSVFAYVTDNVDSVMHMLTGFAAMVAVLAVLGWLGNVYLSYKDRKREFELYAVSGMSLSAKRKVIVTEGVINVCVGLAVAAVSAVLTLLCVQNMLKTLGLYFSIL